MSATSITGAADLRDQRWLDERVEAIEDGIEAVLDIARNWTSGRNLARLHIGSAQDYILARVKHPLGRGVVVPLLESSDWSNVQIAAVAGVSRETVRRIATSTDVQVDRPTETLGADGKYRPARVVREVVAEVIEPTREEPSIEEPRDLAAWAELTRIAELIEALASIDAPVVAGTVPERRRATTAKRLRRLGTYLGSIAWSLERMGEPQ